MAEIRTQPALHFMERHPLAGLMGSEKASSLPQEIFTDTGSGTMIYR